MATNGREIATAYVSIVPSVQGMRDAIQREIAGSVDGPLQREAGRAGERAGDVAGRGMASRMSASLQSGFMKYGMVAAAVGAAVVAVQQFTKAAEESAAANAKLTQVAQQMGLVGGEYTFATERLKAYASELSVATGLEDEQVKAVQTKLLTFGELAKTINVAGGAFDRATKAAVDLAAAGFGEAESNAVQLGKALQDPIKGMTALSRSGVTFTAAEQARIRTLVESNRLGDAQVLVLEAIEKQVGGVAEAALTGSQRMSRAFGEIQESIGTLALPAVEALADAVEYLEGSFGSIFDSLDSLGQSLSFITDPMSQVTGDSFSLGDALGKLPSGLNAAVKGLEWLASSAENARERIFELQRLLRPDSIVTPKATFKESADGAEQVATGLKLLLEGTDAAGDAADTATGSFSFFSDMTQRVAGSLREAAAAGSDFAAVAARAAAIQASMADLRFEASLRGLDDVTAATRRLAREQRQLADLAPGTLDYIEQQREVLAAQIAVDDAEYAQQQDALARRKSARQEAAAEARAAAEEAARQAEELRQQAQSVSDAVRDSLVGDFSNAPNASATGILTGLKLRLDQIRAFSTNLEELARRGIPQWLLQQIVDAGIPDGATLAATLAGSSDADFTRIARAASRVQAAATVAGNAQAARVTGMAPGPVSAGQPVAVTVYIGNEAVDQYVDVRVGEHERRRAQQARAGRRYA